jgi:alpha-tubulin suppressor-like RCC1 family protein
VVGDGFGFCAKLRNGQAVCWGTNYERALGDGRGGASSGVPVRVSGLAGVASLATDGSGWCAVLSSGGARCWGSNSDGALGNGSREARADVPVAVKGLVGVASLVGGYNGYCALVRGGGVECWGDNFDGALGDASTKGFSDLPVTVKVPGPVTSISFSGDYGYCALATNGEVRCWGSNDQGTLGDGGTEAFSGVPVRVAGLTGATSVASDGLGYCARQTTGEVRCWGSNSKGVSGALGDGGTEALSAVPVAVKGLAGATNLVSDDHGYCALLKSGGADCWGDDFGGTLGDGGGEAQSSVPVAVKGLGGATGLVSDSRGYCALLTDGTAECWGDNPDGELGNGVSVDTSNTPVRVKGLAGATGLVGGGDGYCALLKSGGAECWGDNFEGALGAGSPQGYSSVPLPVVGLGS